MAGMTPAAPYRREPMLEPELRALILPDASAEDALAKLITRLEPREREAFWCGVFLAGGRLTVEQIFAIWTGAPIPPGRPRPAPRTAAMDAALERIGRERHKPPPGKYCERCGRPVPKTKGAQRATCGADACQIYAYGRIKYPVEP